MITGFNTDIEHQGVTYHVQTEDKGTATPLILSLVYNRGTILASKRSPYDDLLVPTFDEKALIERLQKQHTLMCAAVRAGRIDDLKRMTLKDSASRRNELIAAKTAEPTAEKKEIAVKEIFAKKAETVVPPPRSKSVNEEIPPPPILKDEFQTGVRAKRAELELPKAIAVEKVALKSPKPTAEPRREVPVSAPAEELIIDAVEIVEEEMILPAEAVVIITDFAKPERGAPGKLKIELPAGISFKGGERKTVNILVRRSNDKTGISGADVMVKVLGVAFRPLVCSAKTNADGIATIRLELPNFTGGRAAILIRATCGVEETEQRHSIRQR